MTVIGDLAGITGSVLVPGDEQYAAQTALFNLHLALTPDIVVIPDDAADVQAAVRYAADRKMPIAVKNSGHQVVLPCEGGLLINTSHGRGDDRPGESDRLRRGGTRWPGGDRGGRTARLGADARVRAAHRRRRLHPRRRARPVFGRGKGYAADHVVSIDVVTADGELRTATADDDPDLFWALRGCKGNFGVVTAIEIGLLPVTRVYAGGLYLPGERSAEILHAWRTSSGSTTMSARWNQDSETSAPPGWLPGGADMGLPGYVVATCS